PPRPGRKRPPPNPPRAPAPVVDPRRPSPSARGCRATRRPPSPPCGSGALPLSPLRTGRLRLAAPERPPPTDRHPGTPRFPDDGQLEVVVRERRGEDVLCEVVTGGVLRSHKGVTAAGVSLDIPALTEKDVADLRLGLALGVDWVAVSYVRGAE